MSCCIWNSPCWCVVENAYIVCLLVLADLAVKKKHEKMFKNIFLVIIKIHSKYCRSPSMYTRMDTFFFHSQSKIFHSRSKIFIPWLSYDFPCTPPYTFHLLIKKIFSHTHWHDHGLWSYFYKHLATTISNSLKICDTVRVKPFPYHIGLFHSPSV